MPTYTNEDYTESLIPEDTLLPAELTSVKEETVNYKDKKTGEAKSFDKLTWTFKITGGDYADQTIRGECDPRLSNHENNTFRQWIEGMLGRELAVGEDIDTDDLVGLMCEITAKHREVNGNIYVNVAEVLPADPDDTPF